MNKPPANKSDELVDVIRFEYRGKKWAEELQTMPLSHIALAIQGDWHKPYFGAVPYIQAMLILDSINGQYGADSGVSIVLYFLANAQTWKGAVARQIKKELNRRVKSVKHTF